MLGYNYLFLRFTFAIYFCDLFKITKAPITPGTHPASVRINTIMTDPHPLSITANGGKMMDRMTLKTDIACIFIKFLCLFSIK